MRNLLVCGTRTIDDAESIRDAIEAYLVESGDEVTFISGGAKGVDSIAADYARSHGYPIKEFFPNWKKYGRAAGPRRNKEMVDYLSPGDVVLAFWDGKSRGTKSTIDFARDKGIETRVYTCTESYLSEGVQVGGKPGVFIFDFDRDSNDDLLSITDHDIIETKQLGTHSFFGYHMRKELPEETKKRFLEFVKYIKGNCATDADAGEFVRWFVVKFCDAFEKAPESENLTAILIPKSSSPLCKMLSEGISEHFGGVPVVEIAKKPNDEIGIDWAKFDRMTSKMDPAEKETLRTFLVKKEKYARDRAMRDGSAVSLCKSIPGQFRKFVGNMFTGGAEQFKDIDMEGTVLLLDDVLTTGKSMLDMREILSSIGFAGSVAQVALFRLKK